MSKKSDHTPGQTPEGVPDDTISTSQEAVAVPLLIGERRVKVNWICEPVIDATVEQKIDVSKK